MKVVRKYNYSLPELMMFMTKVSFIKFTAQDLSHNQKTYEHVLLLHWQGFGTSITKTLDEGVVH